MCVWPTVDKMNRVKKDLNSQDLIELLKETYPCIGTAISLELEHGNYDEIEKLKTLRQKIEKLIL